MKSLEELLKKGKENIEEVKFPKELESKLYSALVNENKKRTTFFLKNKIAASFLIFLLIFSLYNYDALAYLGKKILGYDNITYGSLSDLNKIGRGQEINKSYKLKNGTEVFLDGIFLDSNKLVILYKIVGGDKDKITKFSHPKLKGIFGEINNQGAYGEYRVDNKEINWVSDYQTPNIFTKSLTFSIISKAKDESMGEECCISFKIDRNKVIKGTVKTTIDKSIEIDSIKYNFNSLSATPLSTIIEGNIEGDTKELFLKAEENNINRKLHVEIYETYIKEGKEVKEKIPGSLINLHGDDKNISFKYEFQGLKGDVKEITLKVLKVEDMKIIDRNINLKEGKLEEEIIPNSKELVIKEVKKDNGNTVITYEGYKNITFVGGLFIDGREAKYIGENINILNKNGKEHIEKKVTYEGLGTNMELLIKSISYEKIIDKDYIIYK